MSYTDRSAHANKAKTYIGNIEILARTRPGKNGTYGHPYIYIYIYKGELYTNSMNCIQNKSFCLHNKCVCSVYIYYVYINTHHESGSWSSVRLPICSSSGLLLTLLDYPSCQALWMLFADRELTLALGLLLCLACAIPVCCCLTLLVF